MLKENLDNLKEELFNKKKERGVWDIEQEQHETKMQSLEQEKSQLLEAVGSIKEEAAEKRKALLLEKDKYDELKLKLEKIDKEKIEIDRVSEENKEIKNVMLIRIRELESSLKHIQDSHQSKLTEIDKERARES